MNYMRRVRRNVDMHKNAAMKIRLVVNGIFITITMVAALIFSTNANPVTVGKVMLNTSFFDKMIFLVLFLGMWTLLACTVEAVCLYRAKVYNGENRDFWKFMGVTATINVGVVCAATVIVFGVISII